MKIVAMKILSVVLVIAIFANHAMSQPANSKRPILEQEPNQEETIEYINARIKPIYVAACGLNGTIVTSRTVKFGIQGADLIIRTESDTTFDKELRKVTVNEVTVKLANVSQEFRPTPIYSSQIYNCKESHSGEGLRFNFTCIRKECVKDDNGKLLDQYTVDTGNGSDLPLIKAMTHLMKLGGSKKSFFE